MACSEAKYALPAEWGSGKTLSLQLVDKKTKVVKPLPALSYVRVDFRSAANSTLLLRLTSEDTADIDTMTNTLTLPITRAQMLVLAPENRVQRVLFQARWQDAILNPVVVVPWPIIALDIRPQVVLDVEPVVP